MSFVSNSNLYYLFDEALVNSPPPLTVGVKISFGVSPNEKGNVRSGVSHKELGYSV